MLSGITASMGGTLTNGDVVTRTVQVDTANHSVFFLSWRTGVLNLSLIRPDGQIIDPLYATNYPDVVSYTVVAGNEGFPATITYAFANTQPGLWRLRINAPDVGTTGTPYSTFVAMETDRTLVVTTNADIYNVGDTATFTTTMRNNVGGISGASITATLHLPDDSIDTFTFIDQGNGIYKADYTIPNVPGNLIATITALGEDSGIAFNRQFDSIITVASPVVQLSSNYSDYPEDSNGDNLYETLVLEATVTVSQAGTYAISANLSKNGQVIANTSVNAALTTGTQIVMLRFTGNDLRVSGENGPYTISDLTIYDLQNGGAPAVLAKDVWTTTAYQYSQFGSELNKIYLPVIFKK